MTCKASGETAETWILVRRGMLPYLRGARRAELQTHDGRTQLARSLRLALEDDGVTFIKLGQILATRRDLLPAEFIDELNGLQDDAAQVPWLEVQQVLRSELGADVDDVFASFDRSSFAAASIAQVHAAMLDSGERVVVKIRRPGIDTVVAWDLDISIDWRGACSAARAGGGESARSTFLTGSRRRSGRNST
ncbi:MAG: AarF/UbiB family protein [Solirubrobacteraceae bacterium]